MTLRIGTRGSDLALAQTDFIQKLLRDAHPGLEAEVVVIRTEGDHDLTTPLHEFGGTGVFVKALEQALLGDRCDVAVHSMKDLPTATVKGLSIAPAGPRDDPRDVLITPGGKGLASLPASAVVGTGSIRRQSQLQSLRGDLRVQTIRGNIHTRIGKMESGEVDALLLAVAGLHRAGLTDHIAEVFSPDEILPAPAQGVLAVEWRTADTATGELLRALTDPFVDACATAERSFLKTVEAGCHAPVGALAWSGEFLEGPEEWRPTGSDEDTITLAGYIGSIDGHDVFISEVEGPAANAMSLGRQLAESLLEAGGAAVMERIRKGGPGSSAKDLDADAPAAEGDSVDG